LTMVLGIGLVLWMMRLHGNSPRAHSTYAVYGVIGLATVAMGVLATSDPAWRELADPDTSKLGMAMQVVGMLKRSPVFGVGRGAFESAFPAFREGTGYLVFTHPENVVLQWSTEWGIIVTLGAFAAIAWALRPATVFSRNRSAIGPFCAILCIAVHNLVDFSSEFPGVVIAVIVCAGIVVGGTSGSPTRSRLEAWGAHPRAVAFTSLVVTAGAVALVLPDIGHDLYSERTHLHDIALLPTTTRSVFHADVRAAMLRHPAEPYLPFTGALRATVARDESVIPWAARTLERSPVHGPAHLLLARGFFRGSPAQARLEYRYAMAQAPERVLEVRREVAPLVSDFDDAMELVAPGAPGDYVLVSLAEDVGNRLPATRERLDLQLLERHPDDVALLTRRSEESLRDIAAMESWCAEDAARACLEQGLVRARRLQEVAPQKCAGFSAEAMLLAKSGDTERAFQTLSAALEHVEDRPICLVQLVEVAKLTGSDLRMTNAIDSLARAGCATEDVCVENLVQAATFEEQRGNNRRALAFTRKALDRAPERDDILASAARNASRLGLHAEALDGYERLSRRHPTDGSWNALADGERHALLRR
ncbi:MAG: hypothetical protein JWM74_1325, partial [Myxococcaceae bacterium]|nr:hypothetical protein [Myxococcaceae bacterium]